MHKPLSDWQPLAAAVVHGHYGTTTLSQTGSAYKWDFVVSVFIFVKIQRCIFGFIIREKKLVKFSRFFMES